MRYFQKKNPEKNESCEKSLSHKMTALARRFGFEISLFKIKHLMIFMNKDEILQEIKEISQLYNIGRANMVIEKLENGLSKALKLRKVIDNIDEDLKKEFDKMYANGFYHLDYGLDSQIYNFMNLLKKYDEMLPYLEKAITYLENKRNAHMWRVFGLLLLSKRNDLENACDAWRKAIELDPTFPEKYSGLNVIYVYEAMKRQGDNIIWKIEHIDLNTGIFSVILTKE